MYNETLIAIEDLCFAIANKALGQLGLQSPDRPMNDLFEFQTFVNMNFPKLNNHQKYVYDTMTQAVQNDAGGLYFVDAPGGTGKTFVI